MMKGFGKPKPFDVFRVAGESIDSKRLLAFSATLAYPSSADLQA
jgi:hypothetical protein